MIITSKFEVKGIKDIKDALKLITFKMDRFRKFEPGLFLQLTFDDFDFSQPWPESRVFSSVSYDDGTEKILVIRKGIYTTRIFDELKVGNEFYVKYPFREFILSERNKKVFIAAGAGISVFISYFDYMESAKINDEVILFHSIKTKDEIIQNYYELPLNVRCFSFVTKDKYEGLNRRIEMNNILSKLDDSNYVFYVCEGKEFIQNYSSDLRLAGFDRIKVDNLNRTMK